MPFLLNSPVETSLISLSVRASESGRKKSRLNDSESVSLAQKLGLDIKRYDNFFVHENMVASAILIEKAVRDFIGAHGDCAVVNLGCGYDNFFGKLDNGKIFWYDVDLPEMMEKRKNIFSSGERFMELEGSATESGWTVFVAKDREPLIIAQGLSLHFSAKKIATMLQILTDSFSTGHAVFDFWSPFAMSRLEKKYAIKDVRWGRGIKSCDEILKMNGKLELESEYLFSELMQGFGWKSRRACRRKNEKDSRVAMFRW